MEFNCGCFNCSQIISFGRLSFREFERVENRFFAFSIHIHMYNLFVRLIPTVVRIYGLRNMH